MKSYIITPMDPRTARAKRAEALDAKGDYETSNGLGAAWWEETVRGADHISAALQKAMQEDRGSIPSLCAERYWVRPVSDPADIRRVIVKRKMSYEVSI